MDDDDVEDGGTPRYKDDVDVATPDSFVSDSSSVDNLEDAGLMRRRTVRSGNGTAHYSSVRTNQDRYYQQPLRRCSSCLAVCCKTVLVVAAMGLVGMAGFWLGVQQHQSYVEEGAAELNGSTGGPPSWLRSFQSSGASTRPSVGLATTPVASVDQKTFKELQQEAHVVPQNRKRSVKYDPTPFLAPGGEGFNPFEFNVATQSVVTPPRMNFGTGGGSTSSRPNAYLHHPHLVNNQLAFVSEGDVFVTHLGEDIISASTNPDEDDPDNRRALPAMKLTTTIGNVIDPKFHPTLPFIAYTATYSGRRDVYLMDLRPASIMTSPVRLTYWDIGPFGVSGLVGWNVDDGTTSLIFRALSNEVSLPDQRLYQVHLEIGSIGEEAGQKQKDAPTTVFQIDPVPLAQAIDAVRFNKCWYFVRYKQSSSTIRYVGGTAENLWKYCDGKSTSERLIPDGYKGTSKDPQLYRVGGDTYLLFLSDRGYPNKTKQDEWIPDRMNIWAMKLASNGKDGKASPLIQITDTACDFEGRTIREYSADPITGHLVVRIGADLYFMDKDKVQTKLMEKNRYAQLRYLGDAKTNGNVTVETDPVTETNAVVGPPKDQEKKVEVADSDNQNEERPDQEKTTDEADVAKGESPPMNAEEAGAAEKDSSKGDKKTDPEKLSDKNDKSSQGTNEVGLNVSAAEDFGETYGADAVVESHSQATGEVETVASEKDTKNSTESNPPVSASATSTTTSNDEEAKNGNQVVETPTKPNKTSTDDEGIAVETEIENDAGDGVENVTDDSSAELEPSKYYYDYHLPQLIARKDIDEDDHVIGHSPDFMHLPISVYSDFATQQERLVPVSIVKHFQYGDVFETLTQSTQVLVTLRGQLWVAPVVDDALPPYEEAGKNIPARQYRVVPGAMMGGVTRVLAALHVPNPVEDDISDRRLAVVLATDPLTATAEHAFYLIETQPGITPLFIDMENLPKPFLGGIASGGSTREGGLGSVKPDTLAMSPCGNRMAWSDTDGRIVVMNMPQYQDLEENPLPKYTILPNANELGEPMVGDQVDLAFSPGGRYLAVEHNARNQFRIISIVDLGDPLAAESKIAEINVGRIVQATPSRFNSESAYWGQSPADIHDLAREQSVAQIFGLKEPDDVSTTLYFLSDRDITTDVSSPWGDRQPMPHFAESKAVFALPLTAIDAQSDRRGQFPGGGVEELHVETILERQKLINSLLDGVTTTSARRQKRKLAEKIHPLAGAFGLAERSFRESKKKGADRRRLVGDVGDTGELVENETDGDVHLKDAVFPTDMDIDFGPVDLTFARQAYRVANIPEGNYQDIVCQVPGDGTLVVIDDKGDVEGTVLTLFMPDDFPSDQYDSNTFKATSRKLGLWKLSSSRKHFMLVFTPDGATRVVPNSLSGISKLFGDTELDYSVVDRMKLHMSIWPSMEYTQMYNDAWRMLRDYFYDPEMTAIDWPTIHARYLPLVQRCRKREELDDVLIQMAAELSALHVFVYGGEYQTPLHDDVSLTYANEVASLGASLLRDPAWKGYVITSIPEPDPDFTMIDQSQPIYSPLSDRSLRLSGQRGLQVGDVIVGINGESVMSVPDIHMLLRGMAGKSIRLDVLRLASGIQEVTVDDSEMGEGTSEKNGTAEEATVESVIAVPMDPDTAGDLLYHAWEWRTEQLAQELASKAGISVGYVHLQSMSGASAEDAFARGFFPNYQKQGFILDVRHNVGGNIDAWVLDVLQRKPWMYWQSRDFDVTNGGIGWDEHFAFRGHIVVLLDEKTSSDGEGVSRGISELGLGRLIGTRTWGGGIWLSSDNHLVDGGIATAPEIGTYNEHITWGLGVEQMGVDPDIVVDNDPYETFAGTDRQLERAIAELKKWIEEEPVVMPKAPKKKKDMSMGDRECKA
jgi:C-terminal processing protease CtpA/Prc